MCIARPFVSKVCCSQCGPMCNFFQYRKKSPSFDVRMNMIPEHAGVWSLQSFQCRKWGNIENSSSYHKNIKTLHLQRNRKLEVNFLSLLASLEHDIERLSDWVSVPRGCAMLLRTAPNLFTFQAFAIQLVCWIDVIVIVLSSLLHSFVYTGDLIHLVKIGLAINYESVFCCPTCFWSLVCLLLPSHPSICRITRQLARKPAQ